MANESAPNESQTLHVDINQLTQMIAAAVAQTLQSTGNTNNEELGQTIGNAVAEGISRNTRPRVSFGDYWAKVTAGRGTLRRSSFQNDYHIDPWSLSNREINLLNAITHSGRYINRLVEVVVGLDGSEEVVHIRFNNTTSGQFELKGLARNFEDILHQVVKAQEAERKEQEDIREERRIAKERYVGGNKAYREAVAKAEART